MNTKGGNEKVEKLYVTFTVEVRDSEYYRANRTGKAAVDIQVPRLILESINPGNLFIGALQAALVEFDTPEGENDEEN